MVELILENIHIKYDDFLAVDGVNLTIKDSEIVTLLGPSGCGKTSILRAVAGFNIPSEGKIYLDGTDITLMPPQKRDMGMIFQNYALWPHMTIEANIGYGLKIRKVAKKERKKITMDLIEQVKLKGQDQKYPTQLSGGQQQRVALARALAISPTVLLCDEPLSNLDFQLRVELRTEIREIAKDVGVTVVYVTHDQTEALAISDRIAIIDEGKLIQEDTPINIFTDPGTSFVANFVGENNSLNGTLSKYASGEATIDLDNGEKLSIKLQGDNIRLGEKVDIVVRYDDLEFNPKSTDGNIIHGKLKHLAYMGSFLQIELTLSDNTPFVVNVVENISNVSKLKAGVEVAVKIPQTSMYFFQDGMRIR
ncbi:MAG: ABC transporter ATP-binding protein [Candidatus Heimdallarchaeota archaeon]|nr:ABC transporter ATP-binding protein [Candidatus Heimdallarchaeota archaeon]